MGTKISQFTAATTPLAGTELVPIVQSGNTVKTTVADVIASRLSTSGGVISTNSSTDALRITQTGTGNALVVEDSANPDATPFVVKSDGNLSIGTPNWYAPSVKLAVSDDAVCSIANATFSSALSVNSANFGTIRYRGSSASPSAVLSGDRLGQFIFAGGVSSTAHANSASIESFASENYSDIATGSLITFNTTANGTVGRAERMRIAADGNVGIGTTAPVDKLNISDGTVTLGFKPIGASSVGFFGTRSNHALGLSTNDTERIRIDTSGNVGIGTSAPGFLLDVRSAANTTLHIQGNSSGVRLGASADIPSSGCGYFGTYSNHPFVFGVNNSERLRIDLSGNVGIGTSSPAVKLDLSNPTINQIRVYESGNGIDTRLVSTGGTGNAGIIGTYSNHPFVINTNSTEKVRIDTSGNVGIGTSAPTAKLEINSAGVVQAKIKNTASSADANWSTENAFGNAAFGVNATGAYIYTSAAIPVLFYTGGSEKVRIDTSGNVGIGTSTFGSNAANVLGITNGTAPTSSPAGMGQLYVENGALKYRGSSGTVTTIANA